MKPYLDTVLLLALPASGKSEVRRYLMHEKREKRVEVFHLNDTVQLDDYPYVEFMRETDDALIEMGLKPRFFAGPNSRFSVGQDWGTLLNLVNDDWEVITDPSKPTPPGEAELIFQRIDRARANVGAPAAFEGLTADQRATLAGKMNRKATWVMDELFGNRPDSMEGKTLVIEFARGGPQGSDMPLSAPHGYGWNLSQLRPEILAAASVLYIWVTPEESRRKNAARAPKPGETNTVIFHAAPETVMLNDYGCDDVEWLVANSGKPDTIAITRDGTTYHLPIGRFDNRVDKTTFTRDDPEQWDPEMHKALHAGLKDALSHLWDAHVALRG